MYFSAPGRILLLISAVKAACTGPEWTEIESKCFLFSTTEATFQEAQDACQAASGKLFEPKNSMANMRIVGESGLTNFWIGIIQDGGSFRFASNESIPVHAWAPGQPESLGQIQGCAAVNGGRWFNELCNLKKGYVCEDLNMAAGYWNTCPDGWDLIDGRCYIKGANTADYDSAIEYCSSVQGTVFQPTYRRQNEAVFAFYSESAIWLGINDRMKEGKFKYESNPDPLGYTDWNMDEPNNDGDCVADLDSGWADQDCTLEYPVVCQKGQVMPSYVCPEAIGDTPVSMIEGRCFYIVNNRKDNYYKAVKQCKKIGGRLFEPRSLHALVKINSKMANKPYWIGIRDETKEFDFVYQSTKESIQFSKWAPNQPDKDKKDKGKDNCVQVKSELMYDTKCQKGKNYVCELPPPEGQRQEFWDVFAINPMQGSLKTYAILKLIPQAPPKAEKYISIGGGSSDVVLVDANDGMACLQSNLPGPLTNPYVHEFQNRLLACANSIGAVGLDCFIWGNGEWDEYLVATTDISDPIMYSVDLPGIGIWFFGANETSVVLSYSTGLLEASDFAWTNVRTDACAVRISNTKVALIGGSESGIGDTIDCIDTGSNGEIIHTATLNSNRSDHSCLLIPKGMGGNPTVAIVGNTNMELWDTVDNTVTEVPYPAELTSGLSKPALVLIDDQTFLVANSLMEDGSNLASSLKYNVADGWMNVAPTTTPFDTLTQNSLYLLDNPDLQGFDELNTCD